MKKCFFCIFCVVLLLSFSASAQSPAFTQETSRNSGNYMPNRSPFKPLNPTEDKSDQFEIQGIKESSFLVSNTSDGSANSYNHSTQITLSLLAPSFKGVRNFQLVFYSEQPGQPYAAVEDLKTVAVFYPIALYSEVKQGLTEAFAAKKKVYLKVVLNNNGYREGTLIF